MLERAQPQQQQDLEAILEEGIPRKALRKSNTSGDRLIEAKQLERDE